MYRSGLLALVLVIPTLAADAPQGEVTVVLQDGRKVRGELKRETKEAVVVEVAGVSTRFPRDWVDAVEAVRPLPKVYRKRLKKVDRNTERYAEVVKTLADKAIERQDPEALELAANHLEAIPEKWRGDEVKRLERIVGAVLEHIVRAEDSSSSSPPSGSDASAEERPQWLTDRQIRLVKVYESQMNRGLQVKVDRETEDTLLTEYREEPEMRPFIRQGGAEKLRSLPEREQLQLLFDMGARELYPRVRIQGDPESIQAFRTRIHPSYALRYCGRCHHGGGASGLNLLRRFPRSRRTTYTNYVILRRMQVGDQPLVDPKAPTQSPFLQFGLPRQSAVRPHPKVAAWQPFFQNKEDRLFQRMAAWMGGLYSGQQRYPVSRPGRGTERSAEGGPSAGKGKDPAKPKEGSPPSDERETSNPGDSTGSGP